MKFLNLCKCKSFSQGIPLNAEVSRKLTLKPKKVMVYIKISGAPAVNVVLGSCIWLEFCYPQNFIFILVIQREV